jgi:hypothetical protein
MLKLPGGVQRETGAQLIDQSNKIIDLFLFVFCEARRVVRDHTDKRGQEIRAVILEVWIDLFVQAKAISGDQLQGGGMVSPNPLPANINSEQTLVLVSIG